MKPAALFCAALSCSVALALTACGSSLKAPSVQGEPPEYVEPPKGSATTTEAPAPPAPAPGAPGAPEPLVAPAPDAGQP